MLDGNKIRTIKEAIETATKLPVKIWEAPGAGKYLLRFYVGSGYAEMRNAETININNIKSAQFMDVKNALVNLNEYKVTR